MTDKCRLVLQINDQGNPLFGMTGRDEHGNPIVRPQYELEHADGCNGECTMTLTEAREKFGDHLGRNLGID